MSVCRCVAETKSLLRQILLAGHLILAVCLKILQPFGDSRTFLNVCSICVEFGIFSSILWRNVHKTAVHIHIHDIDSKRSTFCSLPLVCVWYILFFGQIFIKSIIKKISHIFICLYVLFHWIVSGFVRKWIGWHSNLWSYNFLSSVKPLTVQIMRPTKSLIAGRRVEIQCQSSGSRPPAVLTWVKSKRKLMQLR